MKKICLSLLFSFSFFAALPSDAGYNKDYIGKPETYRAVYEDTFVKIADRNGLGYVEMRAANPRVDPWIPGEGTKLILPKRHIIPNAPRDGIIINLPEMRLYFFPKNGDPVTYAIGVGREGLATPIGTTKIVRKKDGPTWRPTARMRKEKPELPASVGPGPKNPLGTHALYLGWPEYLIHGTNKAYGIGRRVSSGCIRMYPQDIVKMFDMVPTGTPVHVVDQPVKAGWVGNEFYVEIHSTKEDADLLEENLPMENKRLTEKDVAYIIEKSGSSAESLDWDKIRQAADERTGYPVMIASRGSSSEKETKKALPVSFPIIEAR